MLKSVFWSLVVLACYSYALYPVCLLLLIRLGRNARPTPTAAGSSLPSMTLIVTAYNEEKRIREKLENCLELNYPDLRTVVASDCSDDRTDEIVREYADRGVRLVRAGERKGKENAQLAAIRASSSDILVFSDVATRIPPDALQLLARHFREADVGAVSSEDRFISNDGSIVGEGAYVRYEMWLRRMESRLRGVVGLSGSFFAARSEVCARWDISSPSDFNTALECARAGLRAVSAPDVHGYYRDIASQEGEYQRKVRTVLRGITAIFRHVEVLNPVRYGLFSWQVWSHKLMRWAVPGLMGGIAVCNLLLLRSGLVYQISLAGQMLFYGVAAISHVSPVMRRNSGARLVYFFVQVNTAIAHAWLRYLGGQRMAMWTPSQR